MSLKPDCAVSPCSLRALPLLVRKMRCRGPARAWSTAVFMELFEVKAV